MSAAVPGAGQVAETVAARQPRSAMDLFLTFSWLALQGFGGVLAVAQHELVERKQWLTREQFLDSYSLASLLPGPNVVNLSLMLGDRFFGWRGALAALAGMLLFPLLICMLLAAGYDSYAADPRVAGALRGMGAVSAGLLLAMAVKMALALRSSPLGKGLSATVVLVTLAAIVVFQLPLAWIVLGFGALAWMLATLCIRRREARQ